MKGVKEGGRQEGSNVFIYIFFFRVMSLLHACLPKSYNFQA